MSTASIAQAVVLTLRKLSHVLILNSNWLINEKFQSTVGQKNHVTSRDKKIMQHLGTKKMPQFLWTKKNTEPLETKKKSCNLSEQKKLCNLSGGGGQQEHIPVFKALLKTTDPHQKPDLVHAKMLTASTLKKHARGDNTQINTRTSQLIDQIGPVS